MMRAAAVMLCLSIKYRISVIVDSGLTGDLDFTFHVDSVGNSVQESTDNTADKAEHDE